MVGPTYRISLLGLFTAPVVAIFQVVALAPGMLERDPQRADHVDPWGEAHAAFSVLAYGAFALGAVAGSACLGMLIPPSVLMIVWGILTEQSIGRLFLAGVLPGILLATLFIL